MIPEGLKYTREHVWIDTQGQKSRVGITDYAQEKLGEVIFVELPQIGRIIGQGEPFGVIESMKAVAELYAPCTAMVTAVNEELMDNPQWINTDPYGQGWIIETGPAVSGEGLLTAGEYLAVLRQGE